MAYRTPVKRAVGLGSAKDGVHHWWMQRVTAIALVPLVLWFTFSMAVYAGADFETVRAWIATPMVAVLLIALIVTALFHAQLGLQVVLEDYVQPHGLQLACVIAVKFLAVLLILVGVLSVLRIALGGQT
jgi:succinate dehydrogenase / fumarate reductase, membrane anchor subunit